MPVCQCFDHLLAEDDQLLIFSPVPLWGCEPPRVYGGSEWTKRQTCCYSGCKGAKRTRSVSNILAFRCEHLYGQFNENGTTAVCSFPAVIRGKQTNAITADQPGVIKSSFKKMLFCLRNYCIPQTAERAPHKHPGFYISRPFLSGI